jgi:hypothetical protein
MSPSDVFCVNVENSNLLIELVLKKDAGRVFYQQYTYTCLVCFSLSRSC